MSPRRRPMISSVSVENAWVTQVNHTSSDIFTLVSDIFSLSISPMRGENGDLGGSAGTTSLQFSWSRGEIALSWGKNESLLFAYCQSKPLNCHICFWKMRNIEWHSRNYNEKNMKYLKIAMYNICIWTLDSTLWSSNIQ